MSAALPELLLYAAFLSGQMLFMLNRMDVSMHISSIAITTRRAYISRNWVVLITRLALEATIFLAWQHGALATYITNHTNYTIPPMLQSGPMAAGLLGYFSDSAVRWFETQKWFPDWLRAVVPQLPNGTIPFVPNAGPVPKDIGGNSK